MAGCGPSGGGGLSCGGGGGGGSRRALLPLGALLRNDPAVCGAGAGRARPPPFASCRFSSRSRWSSNRSSGPPAKLSRARRCWYLWSSVIRLGAPELVPTSPSTLQSVVPHCMDSPVRSASSFDGGLRTFRGASSLFAMGAAGGAFTMTLGLLFGRFAFWIKDEDPQSEKLPLFGALVGRYVFGFMRLMAAAGQCGTQRFGCCPARLVATNHCMGEYCCRDSTSVSTSRRCNFYRSKFNSKVAYYQKLGFLLVKFWEVVPNHS
jgi:hypothetical protein